ncbi:hypothetical protein SBX64_16060 [Vibrio rhizosphaerae]|uniref:Uncharacterized protein n=1 Tax=Vibrio rhizosphaerae TaxID=398736 RepID=A0ABU4J0L2_9VIBR|nr:hypothetical protein [Vibrio rhizosphaerae]MDW6094054.1 hypothetical protein [Vibrio rhizosphaerae]
MMNMVPVDDFIPMLRSMVSNAITLEMKSAIVQAAITFCRKSKVVIHTRTIDSVFAGETVRVVENSGINRRTPGSIKSAEIVSIKSGNDDLTPGSDYINDGLDSVKFKRDIGEVDFVAIVEPDLNAKFLPAILMSDWCNVLCHGAASILNSKSSGPEVQMTSFHEREFIDGIRRAYRWRVETLPELNPKVKSNRSREFF